MLEGKLTHTICVTDVIEEAIEHEKIGSKFYLKYADKFENDPDAAKMFQKLAKEDQNHCSEYQKMLEDLKAETCTRVPEHQFQQFRKYTPDYFNVYDEDWNLTLQNALEGMLKYEEKVLTAFHTFEDSLNHPPEIKKIVTLEEKHVEELRNFVHSRHSSYMLEMGGI